MATFTAQRHFWVRLLLVAAILLVCSITTAQEVAEAPTSNEIMIEDYLAAMSDEQLIGICQDRGFGIEGDEVELERKDYVEAARRCLSMEDEMNAVLAENPELAAELEAEVLRMKETKERLEVERDQMLAEKELLEQQLKDAGVDTGIPKSESNSTASTASLTAQGLPQAQLTLEEVLIETFGEVFHRVSQDIKFVGNLVSPVLQPVIGGVKMAWRNTLPLVEPQLAAARQKLGPTIAVVRLTLDPLLEKVKVKVDAAYGDFQVRVEKAHASRKLIVGS